MKIFTVAALCAAAMPLAAANAHDVSPLDHAPIGVMGDHRHKTGEVMFSYRFSHSEMKGNQIGTESISPAAIVTTVPNRFFGMPGQPPTLRSAPSYMHMDMHMLGVMYGVSDAITLTAMTSYVSKEMEALVYQGPTGAVPLGRFRARSDGFGDLKAGALVGIIDKVQLIASVSIPTGSTSEHGTMLTPMGTRQQMRQGYGMQLGSGTWDLEPGVNYAETSGPFGWGAQVRGVIRLGDNGKRYALGDKYMATAWAAYRLAPWLSASLRLEGETEGRIEGADAAIMGPSQSANPDYYGGERVHGFVGVNTVATHGPLAGYRLGVEAGLPLYQDLNGPQLARDWSLSLGVQKTF